MKTIILKILLVNFLAFFGPSALAEDWPEEIGKITYFQIHSHPTDETSNGRRYIIMLDSEALPNECGEDRWSGYLDTEAGQAQYSAILAAYMAGEKIRIQGTDSSLCVSGTLLIRNVYLKW